MSNQTEVGEFVRRAQDGDMAAFDDLVRQFQSPIFNLAYRMVGNREDASDIAQEVFVKMYRSIARFRGESKFSTWLYVIAANTSRSYLKSRGRRSRLEAVSINGGDDDPSPMELVDDGETPAKRLERTETEEQIQGVIDTLSEEFREVIALRDVQDLSYDEIAAVLGCSEGTVKSRLSRARMKVKDMLSRKGLI